MKTVKLPEVKAAALTRYIFKAPNWTKSLLLMVPLTMLIGIATFRYSPLEGGLISAFFLFTIPAVFSLFFTTIILRCLGFKMSLNRSALLTLFNLFILGIFVLGSILISIIFQIPTITIDGLIFALGFIFAFRLVILLAFTDNHFFKILFPASLHTVSGAAFLGWYSRAPHYNQYYLTLSLAVFICILGAYLFRRYIDAPWKKSFGFSAFEYINAFFSHLTEGTRDIEKIYSKFGEDVDVPLTVFGMKGKKGIKGLFLLPVVHPGPFGDIGGSDLPNRLTKGYDDFIMVPHGMAHHDFNVVSSEGVEKILSASKRIFGRIEYQKLASKSVRIRDSETSILGQAFGDSLMLAFTTAPHPSEDVEFSIGMTAMAEARIMGAKSVCLIDSHNCTEIGMKTIPLGSKISYQIIRGVSKISKTLLNSQQDEVKVGLAKGDNKFTKNEVMEFGRRYKSYRIIEGNLPNYQHEIDDMNHEYFLVAVK